MITVVLFYLRLQAWIHHIQMQAFPWMRVPHRPTVKTTLPPTTPTTPTPKPTTREGSKETSGGMKPK